MKAIDLIKVSKTAKEIFKQIEECSKNNPTIFKYFIPHFEYVSPEVQMELISMGFKISQGEWFRGDRGLIIEW